MLCLSLFVFDFASLSHSVAQFFQTGFLPVTQLNATSSDVTAIARSGSPRVLCRGERENKSKPRKNKRFCLGAVGTSQKKCKESEKSRPSIPFLSSSVRSNQSLIHSIPISGTLQQQQEQSLSVFASSCPSSPKTSPFVFHRHIHHIP